MTTTTLRSRIAAAALLGAGILAASAAHADSLSYAVATDNWTFTGNAVQTVVEGMTTPAFTKPANIRLIVTFSAECAVNAPAGDTSSWVDVDLVLLNASTGAVVTTLAPTAGSGDAFCASNGVAGFQGWATHSVQGLVPFNIPAGSYKIQVLARPDYQATGGWLGERMLTVMQ